MSPFSSDRQRKYMHANHPEIAKRWEKKEKKAKTTRRARKKGR